MVTSAQLGRLTQRDMTPKEPQRVDRVEGDATQRDGTVIMVLMEYGENLLIRCDTIAFLHAPLYQLANNYYTI